MATVERLPGGLQVRAFSDDTEPDAVALINRTIRKWPYCRPVDAELVSHWRALGAAFQPENMLVAYRRGRAVAFLHGEREGEQFNVRFLAIARGAVEEAALLLAHFEGAARAGGCKRLVGPTCNSGKFYAGYILGLEPYHPHWYTEGTEAFIRAGYGITQNECLLVATPDTAAAPGATPEPYRIVEAETRPEFLAEAFRYAAVFDGKEVATCAARLYPRLQAPSGGPVGQIGYVGTDEEHRGRGLATLMTEMCLKRLFGMGASEVLISTGLDNPPALRAYEKAGFRRRHSFTEWSKI